MGKVDGASVKMIGAKAVSQCDQIFPTQWSLGRELGIKKHKSILEFAGMTQSLPSHLRIIGVIKLADLRDDNQGWLVVSFQLGQAIREDLFCQFSIGFGNGSHIAATAPIAEVVVNRIPEQGEIGRAHV